MTSKFVAIFLQQSRDAFARANVVAVLARDADHGHYAYDRYLELRAIAEEADAITLRLQAAGGEGASAEQVAEAERHAEGIWELAEEIDGISAIMLETEDEQARCDICLDCGLNFDDCSCD